MLSGGEFIELRDDFVIGIVFPCGDMLLPSSIIFLALCFCVFITRHLLVDGLPDYPMGGALLSLGDSLDVPRVWPYQA